MSTKIKLVSGDNRPYITLTLTALDGVTPLDLTGATVNVYFRAAGSSTILATLPCTLVNPSAGTCRFNFPNTTLNVAAGAYEGEVEISFPGGDKQTVYDLLKFQVRDDLA